jgi:hypothetical protein
MTTQITLQLKYLVYRVKLVVTTLLLCAICIVGKAQQPTSPEFSSFQSVSTQGAQVDEYSGNFSYNLPVLQIPGPEGGGYALSLSYSNVTANQEASWVGFGWTLNPGSITREKVGFPDEFRGEKIKVWNKTPANNTFSVGADVGLEAFSFGLGVGTSIGYNNYNGFFLTSNVHAGLLGVGVSVDLQDIGKDQYEPAYSTSFDPFKALNAGLDTHNFYKYTDKDKKMSDEAKKAQKKRQLLLGHNGGVAKNSFSFIDRSYHGWVFPEKSTIGFSISGSLQLQVDPGPVPIGFDAGLSINFSRQQDLNTLLGAFNPESHFSEFDAFGYMYSGEAENEYTDLMDFTLDMDGIYSRRSKFLPMPTSGADIFVATGEGITGGFRLHNKSAGHFRNNETLSTTVNFDLGMDVHFGMDAGVGVSGFGFGGMERKTNAWHGAHLDQHKFKTLADGVDEPYYYRFNNDMAGTITFGTAGTTASVEGGNLSLPSFTSQLEGGGRALRSSFIAFHTNEQMLRSFPLSDGPFKYMASLYDPETEAVLNRSAASPNEVGEFAIHNADGQLYTYAYPVYARNEKNFSVSANPDGTILGNAFALKNIYDGSGINPGSNRARVVGSEIDAPYPIHYLLTSITAPNYIDVTKNGPTSDDIGGYVKFSYIDITSSDNWFHSRQPVAGLDYTPGDLSDPKDDMVSFSSVEKQAPYLSRIDTKTHYALFILSDRDEYEAPDNETADTWDWQENEITTNGLLRQKKLDRIELYLKHDGGDVLVQTVNFAYETEDNKKLARASLTAPDGKLTLKRVWSEQRDIRNALISPYEFQYVYPEPNHFPAAIQEQYPDIANYKNQYSGQNDEYSPLKSDAWGYFDVDDNNRQMKYQTWKNQVPGNTDPAMWQLKQIILPTQGEIHIQYEPDDYVKVQDQNALAMVATRSNPEGTTKYYLQIEDDLGLGPADYEAYRKKLEDHFITKGEKLYFKFLYSLLTNRTPALDHCDAEYVDGYVDVSSVGYDEAGFFVKLEVTENRNPKSLCQQMVQFEKSGMLTGGSGNDCLVGAEQLSLDNIGDGDNLKKIGTIAYQLMNSLEIATRPTNQFCTQMNWDLSYVRVPVLDKKIGGGLRVKRLLQFDKGIEENPVMTGVEYHYNERVEGRMVSTGVASNEPGGIAGEHALQRLEKDLGDGYETTAEEVQQKLKLIGGAQRDHREGPVGRAVLPSPSVGYSKVFTKNIHPEEQTFRVSEFMTAASYPVKANFNTINRSRHITPPIVTFDVLIENREWATQTYTIDQVDAAGKPIGSALRKGIWNDDTSDIELASTRIEYFDPFQKVPASADGSTVTNEELGVASEAVMFSRSLHERGLNTNIGLDMTVGFIPPFIFIPYPIPSINVKMNINELNQHTISVVSQRPLIQKLIVQNDNGIITTSENVAFDPLTGTPSIVKSFDDYHQMKLVGMPSPHDGSLTQKQFPAHATYPGVGSKSENEGIRLNQFYSSVILYKPAVDKYELSLSNDDDVVPPCEIKMRDKIAAGDLLEIRDADFNLELYQVSETIKDGLVTLYPLTLAAAGAYDEIADATPVEVVNIKSGRTNQLSASVGSILLYGKPGEPVHSSLHNHIIDLTELFNEAVAEDVNDFEIGAAEFPSGIKIQINGECASLDNTFKVSFSTSAQPSIDCSISVKSGSLVASGSIDISVPVGTTFSVDDLGRLRYFIPGDTQCGKVIECFQFCLDGDYVTQENVLSISAQILSDDWALPGNAVNPYETGEKGKWRTESAYAFLSPDVIKGNNHPAGERNYKDAGTFIAKLFNWQNTDANEDNGWIKTQKIVQYTASGLPVLKRDALNIPSVVKYDHNNLFPLLVAANATAQNVMFENGENIIRDEDGDIIVTESWLALNPVDNFIDSEQAHTGKKSIGVTLVNGDGKIGLDGTKAITEHQNLEGYSIRMWIRASQPNSFESKIKLIKTDGSSKDFKVISGNNEWKLVEVIMTKTDMQLMVLGQPLFSRISFTKINGGLRVDDIQIKPLDAAFAGYVYDRATLQLVAEINNANFAKLYQYDLEGKLTRIRAETDKGIFTVKESFTQMRTKTREE